MTSDTCNGARKTCHIIVEQVHEAVKDLRKDNFDDIRVLEFYFWNHLRNVWLGGMTKTLSTLLGNSIREELYEIDSRLRVYTSIKSVLCAVNKEFSLCANYPKGHIELFHEWIDTYHPLVMLLHVDRAPWSCQDLSAKRSGVVYMNRPYWVEFFDKRLRTPGDNILQENIFIILSLLEMTALACLCVIIHITICLSTRWLVVNFHILAGYNWSMRSMGRMVDELEVALEDIEEEGGLILRKEFIMLIFQGIMDELPPFEKYWTHMFQNKSMPIFGDCQSKVLPFSRLLDELFSPEDDTNKDKYAMIGEMTVTSAKALISEIRNEKNPQRSICQVLGGDYVRILHPMLTMRLFYSNGSQ